MKNSISNSFKKCFLIWGMSVDHKREKLIEKGEGAGKGRILNC